MKHFAVCEEDLVLEKKCGAGKSLRTTSTARLCL
jgi:hypothetical protein